MRHLTRLNLREEVAAFRRLVITEEMRHPELRALWRQGRPELERLLAGEIEHHHEAGTLRVPDPGLAARQLITLVLNEAVDRSRYGLDPLADDEIDALVDEGVGLWMRAYRA